MSWKPEVEGIEKRRELAAAHGGEEAVAVQHSLGRLTIRERIAALADADSFREQGPIAGHSDYDENGALRSFTPANYVLGIAKIDGRPCVLGAESFGVHDLIDPRRTRPALCDWIDWIQPLLREHIGVKPHTIRP